MDSLLIQSHNESQTIELNAPGIYKINGLLGTSDIEIKDNTARFVHSNCTQKICIQHGWLSRFHPVIACVPNEVSIQLHSFVNNNSNVDAFAF